MTFDKEYFHTARYAEVSFKKFSQYWWSNRYFALLARKFGPPKGRVLEIGCGMGHLLGWLVGRYQVFGGDINEWALLEAKNNVPEGNFQNMDAEDLSHFEDGFFDIIIAKHVVEHLNHPEKAAAEIGRVLAPGGVLVLATPNLDSPMRARKDSDWVGYKDPTHISLKPPADWLEMLGEAGIMPKKVFSDGFWDPPYVRFVPGIIQRLWYGLPGGLQAILGWSIIPLQMGESLIVIGEKTHGS
ncbi:MAG: class I SAM-dependent methyltransferase [Anaerolineae bacterium]|nr:class I SAM-dependent methyltransferase [Anaerolineae bacterium]